MNYTDENRGKIHNRERGRQIIDYSGVRYGRITPTDIDGFFEQHNDAFVFYEMKYGDAMLPQGQLKALVRLVNACWNAGMKAALIIGQHDVANPDDDIRADAVPVRGVYLGPKFRWCTKNINNRTIKQMTDDFLSWDVKRLSEKGDDKTDGSQPRPIHA